MKALIARAKEDMASLDKMFTNMERQIEGFATVNLSLMDDDAMRPPDYFVKKRRESSRIKDPQFRKMQKKADKSKAGISRAQSVKWFKDVEMKKGAGQVRAPSRSISIPPQWGSIRCRLALRTYAP